MSEIELLDEAAAYIAVTISRASWAGLRADGRATDNGFKPFNHQNARQEDYRDVVREVVRILNRSPSALTSASAVAEERERCIALCESWIGTFQDRDIQYTSAREYAVGAIEDIVDLIRDGTNPLPSPPSVEREE